MNGKTPSTTTRAAAAAAQPEAHGEPRAQPATARVRRARVPSGARRCLRLGQGFLAFWVLILTIGSTVELRAAVVYETTSAYHHIRVVDERGIRKLTFDRAEETRVSLANPLVGHFQYVEYFFMPWLWNTNMTNVLMIGLGGGSAQRLYEHYCTNVTVETVEVDPVVRQVAQDYFAFITGPRQRVFVEDGRQFVRRSNSRYGAILLDAYVQGRYGSSIPHHLVTQEFFVLARDHLTTNGVVAYNVMGSLSGWRADIVGSVYRTMRSVFPQVYLFPASESQNVVLIATVSEEKASPARLRQQAGRVIESGQVRLPTFAMRVNAFQPGPPPNILRCPVLTDDYAPVDGLLSEGRRL